MDYLPGDLVLGIPWFKVGDEFVVVEISTVSGEPVAFASN